MNAFLKPSAIIVSATVVILAAVSLIHERDKPAAKPGSDSTAKTETLSTSADEGKDKAPHPGHLSPDEKALGTITPAEAASRLDKINRNTNLIDRAREAGEIIKELCLAGFQEEAWALVTSDQGLVRNHQLISYFLNARLSTDQFCEKYDGLRANFETVAALSGWLQQRDLHEIARLLDPATTPERLALSRRSGPELFSGGICGYLQDQLRYADGAGQKDILDLALSLRSKGALEPVSVQFIVNAAKFEDPFQKWALIGKMSGPETDSFLEYSRTGTISEMVRNNPQMAIDALKDSGHSRHLQLAVSSWIHLDTAAALRWYAADGPELDDANQSAAASAFFTSALGAGEMDGAGKWAREIRDQELREDALRQISDKLAADPPN